MRRVGSARRLSIALRMVVATVIAGTAIGVPLLLDGPENRPVRLPPPAPEVIAPPKPTLVVSESIVHAGDVIDLHVQASQDYIWGVPTSFEQRRAGRWVTLFYWRTWRGKAEGVTEPFKARKDAVFELIGFKGDASFRIRIPLVPPGSYRITNEFREDTEFRSSVVIAEVQIEVIP